MQKKAEDAEKCSSNFHNFFRWKVFSHLIECVVSRSGYTRDTDRIYRRSSCLLQKILVCRTFSRFQVPTFSSFLLSSFWNFCFLPCLPISFVFARRCSTLLDVARCCLTLLYVARRCLTLLDIARSLFP